MRVLITGSRTWPGPALIWREMDGLLTPALVATTGEIVVVHGAAVGVDTFAQDWVSTRAAAGWSVRAEVHVARWATEGRGAGILRNQRMVALGADLCLAFIHNGSRGASHGATAAQAAGIETRIHHLTRQ